MSITCPLCGQDAKIQRISVTENMEIRGEIIPVERTIYHCENCGEEFEIHTDDYDPFDSAYREYRYRKGWVQPEEIKEFREKFGLTQQQMSDLLGIGIASLNRYENGALQTESNNLIIKLCISDPKILLNLMAINPDALSDDTQNLLRQKIEESVKEENNLSPEKEGEFSGKVDLHISKSLHKKLVTLASNDGVNLNQWITTALAESVGASSDLEEKIKQEVNKRIEIMEKKTMFIYDQKRKLQSSISGQDIISFTDHAKMKANLN